jgi:hypothetical protein
VKPKKIVWKEVVAAVQKEASANGLEEKHLLTIWDILSHPDTKIPETHVSKLILSMIPIAQPITSEAVEEIIFELQNFESKTKLAVIKYLIGKDYTRNSEFTIPALIFCLFSVCCTSQVCTTTICASERHLLPSLVILESSSLDDPTPL